MDADPLVAASTSLEAGMAVLTVPLVVILMEDLQIYKIFLLHHHLMKMELVLLAVRVELVEELLPVAEVEELEVCPVHLKLVECPLQQ